MNLHMEEAQSCTVLITVVTLALAGELCMVIGQLPLVKSGTMIYFFFGSRAWLNHWHIVGAPQCCPSISIRWPKFFFHCGTCSCSGINPVPLSLRGELRLPALLPGMQSRPGLPRWVATATGKVLISRDTRGWLGRTAW